MHRVGRYSLNYDPFEIRKDGVRISWAEVLLLLEAADTSARKHPTEAPYGVTNPNPNVRPVDDPYVEFATGRGRTTTDGKPPDPRMEEMGAPQPIDPKTGQHKAYWVLTPEERAKGIIRPVRDAYRHVGVRPKYPLRDLTPEEQERHKSMGYVKYEAYPEGHAPVLGGFWTEEALSSGCGAITIMSRDIAETYARLPSYYGSTFCCHCRKHLPVAEFVWEGSDERVGS